MNQSDDRQGNFSAAFLAGQVVGANIRRVVDLKDERHKPFLLLPDGTGGYEVKGLDDLEETAPHRIERNAHFTTAGSFQEYVQAFAGKDGATRIYLDMETERFLAVLDDHEAEELRPRWGEHQATFSPMATEAWLAWQAVNRKWVGQLEFAEFLEERTEDVVEPDGAKLLTLAQSFKASTTLKFQAAKSLANGLTQFSYVEEDDGSAGTSEMKVPDRLQISLTPYLQGASYGFTAAFRYRKDREGLLLAFAIFGLRTFKQTVLEGMAEQIREATGVPVLFGKVV